MTINQMEQIADALTHLRRNIERSFEKAEETINAIALQETGETKIKLNKIHD